MSIILKPDYSESNSVLCYFCNKEKAEIGFEEEICLRHVTDHSYLTPIVFNYVDLSILLPRCKKCCKVPKWHQRFLLISVIIIITLILMRLDSIEGTLGEKVLVFIISFLTFLFILGYILNIVDKILYKLTKTSQLKPTELHPVVSLLQNHDWKEGSLRNKGVFELHSDSKYFKTGAFDRDISLIKEKFHYVIEINS